MENKENIFKHGSTWLRADFHLHTQKDLKCFNYNGDDSYFVSNYVNALKQKGIHLGVITNHNKFDYEEYRQISSLARRNEIYLLPGTELSVAEGEGGIHVLIIFNEKWLDDKAFHITQFLNSIFPGKTPNEYENNGSRGDKHLIEIVEMLEAHVLNGRDFFLIFAHVEAERGLWSELGNNRLADIGKQDGYKKVREHVLGLQKVRTRDREAEVRKLWGDWFPAKVEGSDCKSIEDIGRDPGCWLKIGEFTFEAVKFALMDHKYRVACNDPGQPQHSYIKNISFKCNGGFLGEQDVFFSHELNTLIGIRGSGKSAILETLRYVMDIPVENNAQDSVYKQKLVEYAMGSGGKAVIEAVDSYGQKVAISRILDESPGVYINGVLQPGISIRSSVIRKPLYLGQKDLASSSEGFEKNLIEKMVGVNLIDIRREINEQRIKVTDAVTKWKRLLSLDNDKKELNKELQNINYNLEKFKHYKLEEKLQRRVDFDKDIKKLRQIDEKIEDYLGAVENLINQYEDDLINIKTYQSKENEVFFKDYFSAYEGLLISFVNIKNNLDQSTEINEKLKEKAKSFEGKYESMKEEFARVERELAGELKGSAPSSIRPDEFVKQKNRSQVLIEKLKIIDEQKTLEKQSYDDLIKELAKLNAMWLNEFNIIQSELEKITENQNSLSVNVKYKGDKNTYLAFMKDMFKGSRIRENILETAVQKYSDFGEIFKNISEAKEGFGNLDDVFESYFMENLSTLLTWQPPNSFVMKYHGRELKDHSIGQRASALILFILSQRENDLIIIDQPEDDIDNQTIYNDVIKLVKKIKPKIQFIFATHNANIPVLGDADQIIACSNEADTISLFSGSIDSPKLQQSVINIMEGGREAFKMRKEIYGLWTNMNY